VLGKAAARALEAQELALEDVKGRVGVRRGAVEGQIEQRLGGDQEQAKAKLAEARERARALEQRHRESAEREQRRLQAAANGGFLAQVSAFARQTVDDAGNSVEDRLDALQDAVDTAFEAAQKAAVALIEAGRKWALDLVATFGQWVKEEVGTLVGKRFPEFAKEFDALVDQAVSKLHQGINLVAVGLKHDVNELVEGLREGCQQLLKSIHEKVGTLSTLARAVVEGDWRQAGLMLLDGALTLLGVDKAQFYKFVGKVQDTLEKIVSDPGAFLDHLEAAMAKGFGQFGDNFLDHLKSGVLEWLFGAVAEAGITLPPTFDLAGVFDITLQVLGLTKAALRKAAVNVIGEENVERVEYVWGYLEQATTQGLSGLWEEAKEFLGGLWDMVVGEAQNWAMVTLVQKAVLKLATMWNPAGALVQVVTTAWDLFQWTLENASRVKQLVDAVAGSMAEIADGVIGKAANWIEQALAKLVPMAVSLLANVLGLGLGLGGIGARLKDIIHKAGYFIEGAIEKLLQKINRLLPGGREPKEHPAAVEHDSSKDSPRQPADMSKAQSSLQEAVPPVVFKAGREDHHLWIESKKGKSEIWLASNNPNKVEIFLSSSAVEKLTGTPEGKAHVETARALAEKESGDLKSLLAQVVASLETKNARKLTQSDIKQVRGNLGLGGTQGTNSKDVQDLSKTLPATSIVKTDQQRLAESLAWIFEHLDDTRNEKLLEAVIRKEGVLSFMKHMAPGGAAIHAGPEASDMFTRDMLKALWEVQTAKDLIKDKFRAATKANHEWLPSDRIWRVVERAGRDSLHKQVGWIEVQHNLRSDTFMIIFKPELTGDSPITEPDGTYQRMNGHVGAAYWRRPDPANKLTKGESVFHDELMDAFDDSLSPRDAVERAGKTFIKWTWDGGGVSPPIHKFVVNNEGLPLSQQKQKDNYKAISGKFLSTWMSVK
jgi:hypothetical protein